jgi:D-methionine transport system substrate-binding protein
MTRIVSTLLKTASFSRRAVLTALFASTFATGLATMPGNALAQDATTIKVGIISGEDEDVWRVVTTEAAK